MVFSSWCIFPSTLLCNQVFFKDHLKNKRQERVGQLFRSMWRRWLGSMSLNCSGVFVVQSARTLSCSAVNASLSLALCVCVKSHGVLHELKFTWTLDPYISRASLLLMSKGYQENLNYSVSILNYFYVATERLNETEIKSSNIHKVNGLDIHILYNGKRKWLHSKYRTQIQLWQGARTSTFSHISFIQYSKLSLPRTRISRTPA